MQPVSLIDATVHAQTMKLRFGEGTLRTEQQHGMQGSSEICRTAVNGSSAVSLSRYKQVNGVVRMVTHT